jgi:hypothetical protein
MFFLLLLLPGACALSVRRTPVMGWSTWSVYGCDISEQQIKEQVCCCPSFTRSPSLPAIINISMANQGVLNSLDVENRLWPSTSWGCVSSATCT